MPVNSSIAEIAHGALADIDHDAGCSSRRSQHADQHRSPPAEQSSRQPRTSPALPACHKRHDIIIDQRSAGNSVPGTVATAADR